MRKEIQLYKVYVPINVKDRLASILYSGYIAEGEQVREFEHLLGEFTGNYNVVATNSCTSALHLSLAMEKKENSRFVLTTPMTCVATNVSITNLNMIPIWVDIDKRNGMLTADSIKKAVQSLSPSARQEICALIYVLWGGDIGNIQEVVNTCAELNIPLIVDAAQGFGSTVDEKSIAHYGDYCCFSFQAIKHITTGDGGCLFVKDTQMLKKASILKWFGIDRDSFRTPTGEINWLADIKDIGYKFHMNNIAAEIGISQLTDDSLRDRLYQYNDNADFYERTLVDYGLIKADDKKGSSNWVYTGYIIDERIDVDQLLTDLRDKNIIASRMHLRNDTYSGFRGYTPKDELPGVAHFEKYHVCLPCGWWVSEDDREYIADMFKECINKQK